MSSDLTGNGRNQGLSILRAERLTLAVLMCGVAALALSDFVSPFYWLLSVVAALLRFWRGPSFRLTEMQASFVGWFGFALVLLELFLGRELVVAFTDFLLILAFAVVVEAATPRNHLHRSLVGLFLLLAAAVLTDSVLYIIPLLAMMWFLWRASSSLYGLHWPGGDLPAVPATRELGWMLMMLVVMAMLFVMLPRFEFHSLLKATQPRLETSGFSNLVQLGDFARSLDTRTIMRVEAAEDSPEEVAYFRQWAMGRYWRGAVLSRFTGSGWQQEPGRHTYATAAGEDVLFVDAEGLAVIVYREASDHGYILLPQGIVAVHDLPQAIRTDAAATVQFVRAPSRRLRLLMTVTRAEALPARQGPPVASELDRSHTPVALREWAGGFSDSGAGKSILLTQMSTELRSWTYDLNAPIDGAHPVASFLKLRRGHCELYATTLALAARELGIASRVINGYLGGDWNELGLFLQIRNLHAHSWVEVWMDGRWQRMDATPAARDSLLDLRLPAVEQIWESIKLSWYRYVLEFQSSDRISFLKLLWQQVQQYGEWLLAGVLSLLLLLICRHQMKRIHQIRWPWRRRQGRQHAEVLWQQLDRWLKKRGVIRPLYLPLRDTERPQGISRKEWLCFVERWESQCYGIERVWQKRDLKKHLRAFLNGTLPTAVPLICKRLSNLIYRL